MASLCLWTGIIGDYGFNVKPFTGEFANSFLSVKDMPAFRGLKGIDSFSSFTFLSICTS